MLKETKNKIAASLQQNIDSIKKEIKGIDAKYKKLADDEKASLKEMLDYYKEQRDSILQGKQLVVTPAEENAADEPEFGGAGFTAEDNTPVEEEKVVDSIFPENNIEKAVDEFIVKGDPSVVEEAVTEQNEPEAEVVEEPVEEDAEESSDSDSEDGWPEFPEEWK